MTATFQSLRIDAQDNRRLLIESLETFSVPFLVYGVDGQRLWASSAAEALIKDALHGRTLASSADDLAGDWGFGTHENPRPAGAVLLRCERSWRAGKVTLDLYEITPPLGEMQAVVVMRTARPWRLTSKRFVPGLSRQQLAIARLVADGLSTKCVAARLHISSHTVRHHLERAFRKLGVNNRAALVGLLTPRLRNPNPPSPSLIQP